MENILQIESFIALGVFALSVIVLGLLNKAKSKINSKRLIFSTLGIGILFGLSSLYAFTGDTFAGLIYLICLQVYAILIGLLLMYLFKIEFFGVFHYKITSELLILFVCAVISYLIFAVAFNLISNTTVGYLYAFSVLTIFPVYVFMLALKAMLVIPPEIYKVWYVDESRPEPDFDKVNIRNIYLLSVEFLKTVNDKSSSNMRVKAPYDLKFGDWFQSFLIHYNEKYEDSPIQYKFLDNSSMGWIFYTKPTFWKGKRYIDANKSIKGNKLSEKETVIASRVKINYQ